ncbi:putative phage abortive infection protein [Priestia aryabhattai]|uniref:putative phage abortive infection protein n=1 Tax=Priestia aryabhattai TaxID=412384 RepID=UPI0030D23A32
MFSEISDDLKKRLKKQLPSTTINDLKKELNEIIKKRETKFFFKKEVIIVGSFSVFLLISLICARVFSDSHSPTTFFDVVNNLTTPVISSFAVYAAFKAYWFQQKQLNIQKNQTAKQSIENQFFQLINLHNEIVNSMHSSDEKDNNGNNVTGRPYFRKVYQKFIAYFNEDNSSSKNKYFSIMRRIDNEEQDQLYHYFRNMYQLFQCVYKNQELLSEKEQKSYVEIINAQLTYYEKQLLFFNTKFYGSDGFFEILTHYDFFRDYDNGDYSSIISKFENEANRNKKQVCCSKKMEECLQNQKEKRCAKKEEECSQS